MEQMQFKKWIIEEFKDVFGFDKEFIPSINNRPSTKPVNTINPEEIMNYLSKHKIGEREPVIKFVNEIHWGSGPGALRAWIGCSLAVMLERQGTDLIGIPRWITKKVLQINKEGVGGDENAISMELLDELEKIDVDPLDSAKNNYNELENLVGTMADVLRRTAKNIFIFEGVRKISDHNYIIRMSVRGQGVEAPDQRRVEENQTRIMYDPETGLIRMNNYNIESPLYGHKWQIMPSDNDWYFCPTQSREEITETLAVTMHWY